MTDKNKNWSRREFMKMAGAAGVGAVVSPMEQLAGAVQSLNLKSRPRNLSPHVPLGGPELMSLC